MNEIIRELAKIWLHLFAVLGVIFLGYVLVEGEVYQALTLLALMVGLGMYWRSVG